jgi:CRP/FNR family transcriptional regulator
MRAGLNEAAFPFLGQLAPAARGELGALRARRVGPGLPLLQRGDSVDGLYLVVAGSLRVFSVSKEGREATLYRVGAGETCILAVTASFQEEPYPAWVEAGTKGGVFVCVPSELARRLLDAEPAFRAFVFAVLSGRIFELMSNLEETQTARIDERVARYLLRHAGADGVVQVTQAGLAAELGTAREVAFRALRSLAARGLIRKERGRITTLDRRALRAFCQAVGAT